MYFLHNSNSDKKISINPKTGLLPIISHETVSQEPLLKHVMMSTVEL